MHEIALDLLILLAGIWFVAVTLRPLGMPTVMGELIVGVLVGPAVLGLIAPGHAIELLAEIGIFFLMFHAGVETQPVQFFDALKRSLGIALAGAAVPFAISFGVAVLFGLDLLGATFVGLTIGTATAVVVTLKCLKDLRLDNTRVARLILASCVINDLLTLVLFSLVLGLLSGGGFEPAAIGLTVGKVTGFFAVSFLVGRFLYPRLSLPFRSEGGKGFTFVLLTAIAGGLFAEAIGLHMILGAYLAGLFFEEKVAHPNLVRVVKDRAYGIAYSFLGPIFFISLGFSVTFDISASSVAFMVLLTVAVVAGQILSAGGMALRMGLPAREAFTVGVGMCGRAEVAFILASLALAQGAIDQSVFSALIFSAFLMNLFTPMALKGCAVLLEGKAARFKDATRGLVQIDKFGAPLVEELSGGRLPSALPAEPDAVVIYGYGPEVDALMGELASRDQPAVVIEEDEEEARRLQARGQAGRVHLAGGGGPRLRAPRPGAGGDRQRPGRAQRPAGRRGARARLLRSARCADRQSKPARRHAAGRGDRRLHADAPAGRSPGGAGQQQDQPARDRGPGPGGLARDRRDPGAGRRPARQQDPVRDRDSHPDRGPDRRPLGRRRPRFAAALRTAPSSRGRSWSPPGVRPASAASARSAGRSPPKAPSSSPAPGKWGGTSSGCSPMPARRCASSPRPRGPGSPSSATSSTPGSSIAPASPTRGWWC